jgi:hypothetical protein
MDDNLTLEHLLGELEDLLRTIPNQATIRHDTEENLSWLGRAAAIIEQWSESKSELFHQYLTISTTLWHAHPIRLFGKCWCCSIKHETI